MGESKRCDSCRSTQGVSNYYDKGSEVYCYLCWMCAGNGATKIDLRRKENKHLKEMF